MYMHANNIFQRMVEILVSRVQTDVGSFWLSLIPSEYSVGELVEGTCT